MCQAPECLPFYPLKFQERQFGNCNMFSLSNVQKVRLREKYLNKEILNINLSYNALKQKGIKQHSCYQVLCSSLSVVSKTSNLVSFLAASPCLRPPPRLQTFLSSLLPSFYFILSCHQVASASHCGFLCPNWLGLCSFLSPKFHVALEDKQSGLSSFKGFDANHDRKTIKESQK